jgi:hypothetical protein
VFTEKLSVPGFFSPASGFSSRTPAVEWTNPLENSGWDRQIAEQNHPGCSFFHSSAWANVLAETYGHKPFYFVTNESRRIRSLLPFMEVPSVLTGKRAVALPFTDSCDPLCADRMEFKELFRNAVEFGKLRGWKYIEFRGGEKLFDGAQPSTAFYSHQANLPFDENAFFSQLKSCVRRAIRKAEKSGVRAEISRELDAVSSFYSLHCKTRRKHGMPPQPFAFFKNIHKHVLGKNLGVVVLAHWKKTPVAGAIFFQNANSAIYKFGAADEEFQHLRGNNLVFWEAIRRFCRHGVKKLDFGRTSINNEGLRRFKLGWNTEEKKIGYFRFSLQQEGFVQAGDQSSGWHNHIFRILPMPASRMIGKALYRHWA